MRYWAVYKLDTPRPLYTHAIAACDGTLAGARAACQMMRREAGLYGVRQRFEKIVAGDRLVDYLAAQEGFAFVVFA
ncbi:TPA: hypothetical protein ACNHQ5_004387 [Escherichia coli]